MLNQCAARSDFHQLSDDQQEKYESLLTTCAALRLSCRCEVVGRDFQVTVAPGLSAATFWLDKFGCNT